MEKLAVRMVRPGSGLVTNYEQQQLGTAASSLMAANSKMINQLWGGMKWNRRFRLRRPPASRRIRLEQAGAAPGVLNPVDHGDGGKHSNHPKHWSHDVEQRPDDH
jgi:hypothetical protein